MRLQPWMRRGFQLVLFAVCCGVAGVAGAQPSASPAGELDRLLDALDAAKDDFRPVDEPLRRAAAGELSQAVDQAERYVRRIGGVHAADWIEYLDLAAIRKQLGKGPQGDGEVLKLILDRYRRNRDGLERPAFRELRSALDRYRDTLLLSQVEKLPLRYEQYLNLLSDEIKAYEEQPTEERNFRIGRLIGWFRRARQVPNLVERLRVRYAQPNVRLEASQAVVSRLIARDVNRQVPVRMTILGTRISGTGQTIGNVQGRLVSNPRMATIGLQMSATTYARTVGYNGPVVVHSQGATPSTVVQQLYFDGEQLSTSPPTATATTNNKILRVDADCRLVRRIGRRRAAKQKGQAEAIAARNAEVRVSDSFSEETAKTVADANTRLREKFREPLLRLDAYPHQLRTWTTNSALYAEVLQASQDQIGALAAPPRLTGVHDLRLALHESALNNGLETALAGKTVNNKELDKLLEQLPGNQAKVAPEEDQAFSITFTSARPVTVEFSEGELSIAIRGRQFTRGETLISKTIEARVRYKLELERGRLILIRQGDVEVEFVKSKRPSIPELAFKTFLRNRFDRAFRPRIESKGLNPEKLGRLDLTEVRYAPGWIGLGWTLPRSVETAWPATAVVR